MRRRGEKGQAVVLMLVATSIMLLGGLGFAIDTAQMYAHGQMAQAAADAAAQAGMLDVLYGTNTGTNAFGSSTHTCTTTDVLIPCVYARNNGFGGTSNDTVKLDFPTSVTGVTLSPYDTPAAIHVTVQRTLNNTFMGLLGSPTATIKAAATAGIWNSPPPILITDPSRSDVFDFHPFLFASVQVNHGPQRSIQVNSSSSTGVSVGGFFSGVDLSNAGPNGTGGDFADVNGPASKPSWLQLGSTGHYIEPATFLADPFATVPVPVKPANPAPATFTVPNGSNGCTNYLGTSCTVYSPGLYNGGLNTSGTSAIFKPGVYYVNGGGVNTSGALTMGMATGYGTDPDTGSGMVIYNTGDATHPWGPFNFRGFANSLSFLHLIGSDATSKYRGILLYEDRSAPSLTHTIGVGEVVSQFYLQGTIYITNDPAHSASLQTVQIGGFVFSGGTIQQGSIIVGALDLTFTLFSSLTLDITGPATLRQVALIR